MTSAGWAATTSPKARPADLHPATGDADGGRRSRVRAPRAPAVHPASGAPLSPRGELALRGDHRHLPAAARGVPRPGARRRLLPLLDVDVAAAGVDAARRPLEDALRAVPRPHAAAGRER